MAKTRQKATVFTQCRCLSLLAGTLTMDSATLAATSRCRSRGPRRFPAKHPVWRHSLTGRARNRRSSPGGRRNLGYGMERTCLLDVVRGKMVGPHPKDSATLGLASRSPSIGPDSLPCPASMRANTRLSLVCGSSLSSPGGQRKSVIGDVAVLIVGHGQRKNGGPTRTRTWDSPVMSREL